MKRLVSQLLARTMVWVVKLEEIDNEQLVSHQTIRTVERPDNIVNADALGLRHCDGKALLATAQQALDSASLVFTR